MVDDVMKKVIDMIAIMKIIITDGDDMMIVMIDRDSC